MQEFGRCFDWTSARKELVMESDDRESMEFGVL